MLNPSHQPCLPASLLPSTLPRTMLLCRVRPRSLHYSPVALRLCFTASLRAGRPNTRQPCSRIARDTTRTSLLSSLCPRAIHYNTTRSLYADTTNNHPVSPARQPFTRAQPLQAAPQAARPLSSPPTPTHRSPTRAALLNTPARHKFSGSSFSRAENPPQLPESNDAVSFVHSVWMQLWMFMIVGFALPQMHFVSAGLRACA